MSKKFFILLSLFLSAAILTNCTNRNNNAGEDNPTETESKTPAVEEAEAVPSFDNISSDLELITTKNEFNHEIEYTRKKQDFAKDGLLLRKDSLGRLLEAAHYQNDTLHGERILYYADSGKKQIVENYHKGSFDGIYQVYYPNGILEQEGNYIINVMDSIWVRYYDSGQLKEEVTFSDNEENGPFKEFHENGNIKAEGFYKNGDNEHGSLKLYNEEGTHIKTMNCKNGICKTVWKKEELQ